MTVRGADLKKMRRLCRRIAIALEIIMTDGADDFRLRFHQVIRKHVDKDDNRGGNSDDDDDMDDGDSL